MNGGIIGKKNLAKKGVWLIQDSFLCTNGIRLYIPSDATVWESFETTTGVTAYLAVISTNTIYFRHGSAAMNLYKTQTSNVFFESYKTGMASVDFTNKRLGVVVYIKNQAVLDKLNLLAFSWGQSTTTRYCKNIASSMLMPGWNFCEYPVEDFEVQQGTPTRTGVTMWDFTGVSMQAIHTFEAGDIVIDAFYYR